MEMYKKAAFIGLRVNTSRGLLSVEQLTSLGLSSLSTIIKNIKKSLSKDNDDDLSFLDESKIINSEDQLAFDILKDIYITKKREQEELRTEAQRKENNQKIMSIIHSKKEAQLSEMSIDELEKMLQ
jgi:hypothetical protein